MMRNVVITFRLTNAIVWILVFLTNCGQTNNKEITQLMTTKNHFDSNEHVFIKLYKKSDANVLYWETWNIDDKNAIIHWGRLGSMGDHEKISTPLHSEFKDKINTLIDSKINEGYTEIPIEKQFTVAITFKLKTWGSPKNLD